MSIISYVFNKTMLYATLTTLFGSAVNIIFPIILTTYNSAYFVSLFISITLAGAFAVTLLILKHGLVSPYNLNMVCQNGLITAIYLLCMIYSAHPQRTPIIAQAILIGAGMIYSCALVDSQLNLEITNNKLYRNLAIVLMVCTIALSLYPLYRLTTYNNIVWVIVYAVGIAFKCGSSVVEEKYLEYMVDFSMAQRVSYMFYSYIVTCMLMMCSYLIDHFLGYTDDAVDAFKHTLSTFADGTNCVLLVIFVALMFINAIVSRKLTEINLIYTIRTAAITVPAMIAFFTLYINFDTGFAVPLVVTVLATVGSLLSNIYWIISEQSGNYVEVHNVLSV
ncbi:MAG: hypothetical protein Faunusvirus10_11 [Faunusvirus sp.]|uniref:Uncharacterized protein n=1 Tax=Faunusvirus sp. TaxID=2487766 RepID=A0A3G4ZWR7_9VIRU|nr:MAG: hypothetical protein Faunusvirus10_11 [Faunusvirus sp.]